MTSPATGLSLPRIVRSEILKLKTLRSTWITLAAAVVVLILAAALISNRLHSLLHETQAFRDPGDRDVLTTPLRGFGVTQLVIGVLGVLSVSGEYATGMIRSSFIAVPRRVPVVVAKFIVFALMAWTTMTAASLAAFLLAQSILGSDSVSLSSPHATRVVLALGSYLAMIGLLGLGLGFIVRSTAGGIASLVGILLVAPGVLAALGTSWAASISHYLPLNAGQAMFNDQPVLGGDLTPGAGTLVMIAWWVGAALVAGVLVRTRDA